MSIAGGLPRKGNITVILIGLVSVMLIFGMALSQRMRGQTQLLTIGDYAQISRYFLEAYADDVLRQLMLQANTQGQDGKTNPVFEAFRKVGPTNLPLPIKNVYTHSQTLTQLKDDAGIEFGAAPEIVIASLTPLEYPPMLTPSDRYANLEKRGQIAITCHVSFKGRKYALRVDYPFTVVMRLTPMLREFVLFCDRIGLEQRQAFGSQDGLNCVFTQESKVPKLADLPGGFEKFEGQPWTLWPPSEKHITDRQRTGRVFFGPDDKSIFLNLAGERNFRSRRPDGTIEGFMSDLWLVWPTWFAVNKKGDDFTDHPVFLDKEGKWISLRGMEIPLKFRNHVAKMGVLGFCYDLVDDRKGFFTNTNRDLEDILGPDPYFKQIVQEGKEYLTVGSSLKPFGLNAEPDTGEPYLGFPREIFGRVFARFFLVTFFDFPSAQGGAVPLLFNENAGFKPPPYPTFNNISMVSFEPEDSSSRYGDFMSRVVSGGGTDQSHFMPYNPVDPANTKKRQILTYNQFLPADGLRVKENFDQFTRQWFDLDPKTMKRDDTFRNVRGRINRYFSTPAEFLKYAMGPKKDHFFVDGVVYVKGQLEIPALDFPSQDANGKDLIRGGVVIAEKGVTVGNITRGIKFDGKDSLEEKIKEVQTCVDNLKQDHFLTFVNINGSGVILKGDKHIGVQVIALGHDVNTPRDQVRWDQPKRIVFCGGIAVNTPNMRQRVRDFSRAGEDPIFMYVPCMSDPDPAVAVQLSKSVEGYVMFADEGGSS